MSNKQKKFDAVKMMRDIRARLNKEYRENPEKREKDLEEIREKYMKREKRSTDH